MVIIVDGRAVAAMPGQSVAAALYAAGIVHLRDSPRGRAPRGAFCMMGVCQECVVAVDGCRRPSCQVTVRDMMVIGLHGHP